MNRIKSKPTPGALDQPGGGRGRVNHRYFASLVLSCGLLVTAPALPNGWEHRAVPTHVLLKALHSRDPAYRARAAMSLGIKQDDRAVERLVGLIESGEPDSEVRAAVYLALGRIADPAANDLLESALVQDEDAAARAQAALALGEFAIDSTVDTLVEVLARESDSGVKAALVSALGAFTGPRAIGALLKTFDDAEPDLRRQTIRAMGRTRSREMVVPLLSALSVEDDPMFQGAIVDALAMIGDPRSRVPLEQLLEQSDNDSVRARVVLALGAIRDGSSIPALVDLLDRGTPEQRYLVLSALTELGDARAAPVVARFYDDVSAQLDALSRDTTLELVDPLLVGMRLQRAAIRVLLELDPASGLDAFLSAAKPHSYPGGSAARLRLNALVYETRRLAISGLGYEGSQKAFTTLVSAPIWNDPDPRIRSVATRAAAVAGHEGALRTIAERLADGDPEVRWTAASALGRLKNSDAIDPLRSVLHDPHSEVRLQALLSLAYLDAGQALSEIERAAVADPSQRVRNAARQAIELLTSN